MGDTVITHTQGHSVGRILEAYRKLRASHPDLMSQLEIMSQPASNVDSVILAWCIEAQAEQYPATLWQRDCFSSVFSDTAAQSMYVANQLSCLVAEKCTSRGCAQTTRLKPLRHCQKLSVLSQVPEAEMLLSLAHWPGTTRRPSATWPTISVVGPEQTLSST